MKSVYRWFAYLIALEVVVQAAVIAFGVFGLGKWVDDGGTFNKAALDSEDLSFTGAVGFMLHGINGSMVIPLLAIVFLVVSFFAKVPGGVKWAAITLLVVIVQMMLGFSAHDLPQLGILHGVNAIILFVVAAWTGYRTSTRAEARVQEGALA